MSSSIDPRIFRAYDIRGKAYEQVSLEACRLIGRAFGTELRQKYALEEPAVAVGRDARTHGPQLEKAVIEGLIEAGCHVLAIGACASPVNYFAVCRQQLDGGVQVTASHNPPDDNGLKLCVRGAEAFAGEDLQKLRRRIMDGRIGEEKFEKRNTKIEAHANAVFRNLKLDSDFGLRTSSFDRSGRRSHLDASTLYTEFVAGVFANAGLGKIIVVDGGNGIAGPVSCKVLRAVGATVEELYTEPDGTFPNHAADPSKHETLCDLQREVRSTGAHVGFAFDGDGDRLGVVDETGAIRSADEILLLLAQDHLKRFPGSPVVFTISNSQILNTEIIQYGGRPVMTKVGHSFVEHAMHEHGSLLGGEQSGHFFCGEDYFVFDDALIAALRILRILEVSGKPLSALLSVFPKVFQTPERRPYCHDDEKADVITAVTQHFQKHYPVNTLDGARIAFGEDSWAGIRQSNTSPCISICVEARSPERLKDVEKEIVDHLKTYPQLRW